MKAVWWERLLGGDMEWELRWRLVPSGKNKFLKYSEERVITFFL